MSNNLKLIEPLLHPDELKILIEQLEQISFNYDLILKVISVDNNSIIVVIHYGQSNVGEILSKKELVDIVKPIFKSLLPEFNIHARPILKSEGLTGVVNPSWVQKNMQKKQIQVRDIIKITGIEKVKLSGWISGKTPMTKEVKAMFYFMLKEII